MSDPIRDEIVARLTAIPGIGVVHGYQRYASRARQLADLYVYNGQLRGWFVRRVGQIETTHSANQNEEKTRWLIRGYLAVNDADASELVFDGLLDAARNAFKTDWLDAPFTGGVMFRDEESKQTGVTIDEQAPVLFADVLCHAAKCTLVTRRFIRRRLGP
jgi:hypothetical protein